MVHSKQNFARFAQASDIYTSFQWVLEERTEEKQSKTVGKQRSDWVTAEKG